MKRAYLLAIGFLLLFSKGVNAQDDPLSPPSVVPSTPEAAALGKFIDVPVSHYTGVPQIGIPLCAVSEMGVGIDIALSYHGSGIKVDEIASRVGLGWSLSGQGSVTRSVRGTPDDYQGSGFLNTSITVADYFAATPIQQATWTIQNNTIGALDFESDMYYFNLPGGASGKFFFQQDGTPVMIPHNQDITINPVQNTAGHIEKWEITTANGLKYYLGKSQDGSKEAVDRTTSNTFTVQAGSGTTSFPETPAHFENYVTTWHLLEVVTPYNDVVEYAYEPITVSTSTVSFSGERSRLSGTGCGAGSSSYTQINNSRRRLQSITSENTTVAFTYGHNRQDLINDAALTKLSVFNNESTLIKEYRFTYDYFTSSIAHGNSVPFGDMDQRKKRLYLKELTETFAGSDNRQYEFEYDTTHILPDRLSFATDFWGYYNGKNNSTTHIPATEVFAQGQFFDTPGADRKVDSDYAKACSLKKIVYPTGGSTTYNFEGNMVQGGTAFFAATDYNLETIAFVNSTGNNAQVIEVPFTISNDPGNFNFPVQGIVDYSLQMYDTQGSPIPLCDPQGFDCPKVAVRDANNTLIADITNASGSIPIVQNGSYKLVVENYSADFGDKIDVFTTISGRRLLDPISPNAVFGGLRVKDVTLRDTDNSQILKKVYSYTQFDDANLSSGRALNPPTFVWDGLPCNSGPVVEVSSNPIFPMDNQGNYSVGYANVTEAFEGSETGKTEYTFHIEPLGQGDQTNVFDTNILGGLNDEFPNTPLHDLSYLRGLLLKQVHYRKNPNQSFSPIQQTVNTYHFRVTSERIQHSNIAMASRGNFHFANDYTNFSERFYMDSSENTTFFYNDSGALVNQLSQTTNYHYDSFPLHNQLTKTLTTNSEGNTTEVETKYAADVANISGLSGTQQNAISRLHANDLHRINTPIEVTTYEEGEKLSTQRTIYKDWGSDLVLPELVRTAKSNDGLEDRLEYTDYDSEGNILEVRQSNGSVTAYVWGYQQTYPVAKVENATRSQIEALSGFGNNFHAGAGALGQSQINQLRSLPNALVTTYTYKPMVGITSMTDTRGYTMYYEYDAFNRLTAIKDADNNLIEDYEYHYIGQ